MNDRKYIHLDNGDVVIVEPESPTRLKFTSVRGDYEAEYICAAYFNELVLKEIGELPQGLELGITLIRDHDMSAPADGEQVE